MTRYQQVMMVWKAVQWELDKRELPPASWIDHVAFPIAKSMCRSGKLVGYSPTIGHPLGLKDQALVIFHNMRNGNPAEDQRWMIFRTDETQSTFGVVSPAPYVTFYPLTKRQWADRLLYPSVLIPEGATIKWFMKYVREEVNHEGDPDSQRGRERWSSPH